MSLKITRAGIFDSIQDHGRGGYQHLGINPGGSMDRFSASLANALLGKEFNAPVIEMHFPAPQILFQKDCIFCLTGADFAASVNNIPVPMHQPVAVKSGTVIQFNRLTNGARCYLALLNNFILEKWLGSYSTNIKAAVGGFKGRKLEKGDELLYSEVHLPELKDHFVTLPWRQNLTNAESNDIAFLAGNEWNWFTQKSQTAFLNNHFTVSASSDRMGFRLQGASLEQNNKEQLVSSAVSFGTVQLLPNGQLIILMADHQTTGGYPRVAHVISADLPKLAQMNPNQQIRFVMTGLASAEKKLVKQQQYLTALQNTCNLKMQNWLHAH